MSEIYESPMEELNEALAFSQGKGTGPAHVLHTAIAKKPSLVSDLLPYSFGPTM